MAILPRYELVAVDDSTFSFIVDVQRNDFKYLTLFEENTATSLLGTQYIEPGDKIEMEIEFDPQLQSYRTVSNSRKVECFNLISASNQYPEPNNSFETLFDQIDSLKNLRLKILDNNRTILSKRVFNVAAADIYGDACFKQLQLCFTEYMDFSFKQLPSKQLSRNREFDRFIKKKAPIDEEFLAESDSYLKFLNFSVSATLVRHGNTEFSFLNNFEFILTRFKGVIRDKMLARLFSDRNIYSYYSHGISPGIFKSSLIKATQLCEEPNIKRYLEMIYSNLAEGSEAYDFSLEKDTSNIIFSLSQLKGKVVLLDMWGYSCTGCYLFAKIFHNEVYSKLKGDTSFAVVSIMLEPSTSKYNIVSYKERLRGRGNESYTYSDYENLYAASGVKEADNIINHYRIVASPFVILLDKEGKIISSTLPLFTSPDSPNVSLLRQIILDALNS